MTLREKQSVFVKLVAELIEYVYSTGFQLTFGETWRSPEEAELLSHSGKGIPNSNHIRRLAIDLNLFDSHGNYLPNALSHKPFGEWWEKKSTKNYKCCWGGRFGDGNHYSIEHDGVK